MVNYRLMGLLNTKTLQLVSADVIRIIDENLPVNEGHIWVKIGSTEFPSLKEGLEEVLKPNSQYSFIIPLLAQEIRKNWPNLSEKDFSPERAFCMNELLMLEVLRRAGMVTFSFNIYLSTR